MLLALQMEKYPAEYNNVVYPSTLPTGAVLVDASDRVLSLEVSGNAHAVGMWTTGSGPSCGGVHQF